MVNFGVIVLDDSPVGAVAAGRTWNCDFLRERTWNHTMLAIDLKNVTKENWFVSLSRESRDVLDRHLEVGGT